MYSMPVMMWQKKFGWHGGRTEILTHAAPIFFVPFQFSVLFTGLFAFSCSIISSLSFTFLLCWDPLSKHLFATVLCVPSLSCPCRWYVFHYSHTTMNCPSPPCANLSPITARLRLPCWTEGGTFYAVLSDLYAFELFTESSTTSNHEAPQQSPQGYRSWNVRNHWEGEEETAYWYLPHPLWGELLDDDWSGWHCLTLRLTTFCRTSHPDLLWMLLAPLCKTSTLKVIPELGKVSWWRS